VTLAARRRSGKSPLAPARQVEEDVLGVLAGVVDFLLSEPLDDPLSEVLDDPLSELLELPLSVDAAVFSVVVDGVVEVVFPRLSFL